MPRTLNDVKSDINNSNNPANMDNWANANNPNNENYVYGHDNDDESEFTTPYFNQRTEIKKPYIGYVGTLEKTDDGSWFVVLTKGNHDITSQNYDSPEECITEVEKQYDGSSVIEMERTIEIRTEPSEMENYYSALVNAHKNIK